MTTTTLPTHHVCEAHSPADLMDPFSDQIREFREFGTATKIVETQAQLFDGDRISVPTYVNEFWTPKQRQASSLHEVSYRACFKPQLPRFFIQRLTQPGDVVYDPFMGRGTTPVEAALHGRIPWGNDLNPLSVVFTTPRLLPPHMFLIQSRLRQITRGDHEELPEDGLQSEGSEPIPLGSWDGFNDSMQAEAARDVGPAPGAQFGFCYAEGFRSCTIPVRLPPHPWRPHSQIHRHH